MGRYFFDIRNGNGVVKDFEGMEMPSPRAALEEAEGAAREILAEKVRRGEVIDGDEFEIRDELGTRLFTLPFRDVLRLD